MASNLTFRMTPQRRMIFEELIKVDTHPTAEEVYMMVRQRLPRISLGTVYRNLEILSERGMIQKLEVGGTQRRFDGKVNHHYHIRCLECGRVEDLPVGPFTHIEEDVGKVSDYEITGHRLEFFGLCPECREEEPVFGKRRAI